MQYKLNKCGSFNIHTIKCDKFKTITLKIFFRNNIEKESIAKRTLLFEMLTENSKQYKTRRDLKLKLESLYNAILYSDSSRIGNEIISSICMEFLNPKYTKDNYLKEAIKLPFDLINNPNVTDHEFDAETLEIVKTRIKADINCLKEDPRKYAIFNSLKKMDKESISSINILGTIDDVDNITPVNLFKEYENILKHDYIDIFIIGDIDSNKVVDLIDKYAVFNTIKTHELNPYIENKQHRRALKNKESLNITQSQLVYIYNTVNLTLYEKKYVMPIYNMILGGGSLETKLYQNLRDKESLCYTISSIYNKYDNLIIISTGIDKKNVDLSCKLIEKSVGEMLHSVTAEEINRAISFKISSLNMVLDSPVKIIDNYLFNYMGEVDLIDDRIKNYKSVTLDDVMSVAKKVKINSIYILEGDKNGKD